MRILRIQPTTRTFAWWVGQSFISNELADHLKEANVLFTPRAGHVNTEDLLFPSGTSDLLQFFRNQQNEEIKADICIGEEDYEELILHSDTLQLPDIIIQLVGAPVLAGFLLQWIQSKFGSRFKTSTIKSSITIEDDRRKRSVNIDYEGSAEDYERFVLNTLRLVTSEDLEILETSTELDPEERIQRLQEKK